MEKPVYSYMELNSPEEQARAAQLLQWDWSSAAIHALTKYSRSSDDELARDDQEIDLPEFLGVSTHTLLDVQRELGGISFDYRANHWLDFDIYGDEEFLQKYGQLFFTHESNGVPSQFIDLQGRVHDGSVIYSSAQKFVEWHVALRVFHLGVMNDDHRLHHFQIDNQSFVYVRNTVMGFAEKYSIPIHTQASDDRNLM